MFGRKTRIERRVRMDERIKQLERIICPGEQHDYCAVWRTEHIIDSYGTTVYSVRYVCKHCGKEITREED